MKGSRSASVICLETSFLVDRFRGKEFTQQFLVSPAPDTAVAVSTVTLYELFAGAIRSSNETVAATRRELLDVDVLGFDERAATEAAEIRATLLDRGERIPAPDILIAGTARAAGVTLVATEDHFERVSGLDLYDPREEFGG